MNMKDERQLKRAKKKPRKPKSQVCLVGGGGAGVCLVSLKGLENQTPENQALFNWPIIKVVGNFGGSLPPQFVCMRATRAQKSSK